jgi:acyl carrier protein
MASTQEVADWLVSRICLMLEWDKSRVNGHTSLDGIGLDSITRASLAKEIGRHYRITIDLDSLYDHATIDALASYIAVRIGPRQPDN